MHRCNRRRVEVGRNLEQKGLVPVIYRSEIVLEEPLLDGCQGNQTADGGGANRRCVRLRP